MNTPYLNKGSAFSKDERLQFELDGLLPSRINTLDEQVARAYDQYQTHKTALGKNVFMSSMKEQNEVLYYRLIQDHVKEMFPIIYTPTVKCLPTIFSRYTADHSSAGRRCDCRLQPTVPQTRRLLPEH